MFLSIIIPVYNIENYIAECINSVLEIKSIEYEVIVILGTSSDKSNEIVKEYAMSYTNIFIYFQNGRGLSNARNCGMKYAKGEYILFLDGDDYINANKLEDALKYLTMYESDVLVSEYRGFYDFKNKFFISKQINTIQNDEYIDIKIKKFLEKKKCFWNVWRYIYKKDFLIKNKIKFKEGTYAEDLEYTTDIFLNTDNIYFFNDYYYNYRLNRKNSLMNVPTKKKIVDTVNMIESNIEKLYTYSYKYKKLFYRQYIIELILNLSSLYEINVDDREEVIRFLEEKENVLSIEKYYVAEYAHIFIKIFTLKCFAYIIFILKCIKRNLKGKLLNGISKKIL
ncbi:MAG: glycosyltransferase family 2 protein [Peptoanaerobacter stomatis]|uniref:glycosyltransferase family 2 protein n=1 Tax=Peptoanaerobacter stomatis TaxID=796937 RepID=UPI003FA18734